jgi:hypothetical protein
MKKPLPIMLLVLLVAACFQPDRDRTDSWSKPGVTEDEIYADISSCRQQANAIIDRDATIDAGTGVPASKSNAGTASDLETNLEAFDSEKRYRRLLAECMHGRGYALSSDG